MKHLTQLLSVLGALALLGWLVFGWSAGRTLERARQDVLAAGLAIDPESADLRMGTIPDTINGALVIDALAPRLKNRSDAWKFAGDSELVLHEAEALLARTAGEARVLHDAAVEQAYIDAGLDPGEARRLAEAESAPLPPYRISGWHAVQQVVDENAEVLADLRALDAMAIDGIVEGRRPFPYRNRATILDDMVNDDSPQPRGLATVLMMSALLDMVNGADSQALVTLCRIEHLATATGTAAHGTIDTFIALGVHTMVARRLAEMSPYVDWSDPHNAELGRVWINRLNDATALERALINGLAGEAVRHQMIFDDMNNKGRFMFRPIVRSSTASVAAYDVAAIAAVEGGNSLAAVEAAWPAEPDGWQNSLAFLATSGGSHSATSLYRCRTDRVMAATVIALHLYRAENGDWPAKLNDVVPMGPTLEQPIRYSLGDDIDPRPRIWTAGPDGDDDGGRAPADDRDADADNVRYLDPGPPPARTW